ncbi:TPA: hypothetical protein KNN56_001727 [Clostridioides difficile]|uniref:hypothetical protein n=1 Tax=Clostridioides difficile TaxID=1496 RepID=UPI00038D2D8D|nr:hypothetical protein [Clostridioides difficile]EGT4625314.1 hypothetical protein [Clostridioides difficile]ELX4576106.1 hypothetical protein [Clostridioides difficile]EQK76138.1 hypothetical protein QEE_1753 [Clostridioides difficile CD113]MBH6986702.1 hypothetical protein [Clostridioides difficile]MBH7139378.1 hypothetical protein [Clostridioides difficile]
MKYEPEKFEASGIHEVRELGMGKDLSRDICNMLNAVGGGEWNAARLPGESEAHAVERMCREINNPEKKQEFMQFWLDYLKRKQPEYGLEIQIARVLTELNSLPPKIQNSQMAELKVLWENKEFLDSQKYQEAIIYHILKKEVHGKDTYQGLAEYGQDRAVSFSPSAHKTVEFNIGYAYTDKYLFGMLEDGYEIAAMTMDGHLDAWEELSRWGIGAIPHKKGVSDYLEYCKENNISAAAIKAATGWEVLDLFKMAELEKQDSAHRPHLESRHNSR